MYILRKRSCLFAILFAVAFASFASSCVASIIPSRILPAIFVGVDEDGRNPEIVSVGRTCNVMIQGGSPPLRLLVGPVKQDGDYLTAECIVEGDTESFSVRVGSREPVEVVCKGVKVRFCADSAPEGDGQWASYLITFCREKRLQKVYEHRMNKENEAAAVAEFKGKYDTYRHPILDHIQERLTESNSYDFKSYAQDVGEDRNLKPVLIADINTADVSSLAGGHVFIYSQMLDLLASKNEDGTLDGPKNPWTSDQIYQMSSLAAAMGHEFARWAGDDFSSGPYNEMWISWLGMSFCENVPEFSIGGEAIRWYRTLQHEKWLKANGSQPCNGASTRPKTKELLKKALRYQYLSSNGFIRWDGLTLYIDGQRKDYFFGRDDVTGIDRTMYVMGQLATAIKRGFPWAGDIHLYRGDEVCEHGNPNETYLLFEYKRIDDKRLVKVLDKYAISKDLMQEIIIQAKTSEDLRRKCKELGVNEREMMNFTSLVRIINLFHANRDKYKYGPGENQDETEG